jgi:hypothetical protein
VLFKNFTREIHLIMELFLYRLNGFQKILNHAMGAVLTTSKGRSRKKANFSKEHEIF